MNEDAILNHADRNGYTQVQQNPNPAKLLVINVQGVEKVFPVFPQERFQGMMVCLCRLPVKLGDLLTQVVRDVQVHGVGKGTDLAADKSDHLFPPDVHGRSRFTPDEIHALDQGLAPDGDLVRRCFREMR